MKIARCARTVAAVALFAGGWFLSTTAWARVPPERPADLQVRIVTLELQIGDQEPFRLSLGMGQAGTLQSPELGGTWLIVPVEANQATEEVTLRISKAIGTRANGYLLAESAAVSLYRDFRQPLAYLPVDVRVLELRRARVDPRRDRGLIEAYTKSGTSFHDSIILTGQSDCCVSCGNTRICGCDVQLGCGRCCTWCCSGPWVY